MTLLRIIDTGNLRIKARSTIIFVVGFLILAGGASGEYDSSATENFASRSLDGNANGLCSGGNCGDRGSGISGAMWFGPRLGKRRKSDEKPVSYEDEQINTIADILQAAPWIFRSNQGAGEKRHATQFTPRLGRESGDEILQKLLTGENPRFGRLIESDDVLDQRQILPPPPPFAPRLGRNNLPSPRLGRRIRALVQKI